MANDFPLIKSLGLELVRGHRMYPDAPGYTQHVRAADVERVLAKGVRVWNGTGANLDSTWTPEQDRDDTHTALLIGIEPVKRETAEDVLRDWLEWFKNADGVRPDLIERTRRAVGK